MSSVNFWALGIYAVAVFGLVLGMMVTSFILGQRHHEPATDEPYESGIAATGTAEVRFSIGFYLVAMLFVVFDLEAAILFAWAVAVPETGWTAFIGVSIFVAILLIALLYEWREGTLDFGPKPRALRGAAARLHAAARLGKGGVA